METGHRHEQRTSGTVITFRPPAPEHEEPLNPPHSGENDWHGITVHGLPLMLETMLRVTQLELHHCTS